MLPIRFGSQLSPVWREFERMLSDESWLGQREQEARPELSTRGDEHAYTVSAEVPGFSDADIKVEVHRGVLTISGKRELTAPVDAKVVRRERSSLSFSKTLSLPDTIDESGVSAVVKDGVLAVTLPKRPEVKPRAINVVVQ